MSENNGKNDKIGPRTRRRRVRHISELPEDDPLRNMGYVIVVGGHSPKPKKKTIH